MLQLRCAYQVELNIFHIFIFPPNHWAKIDFVTLIRPKECLVPYVLIKIGRVGRDYLFVLFLFLFISHDSLQLDGFNRSVPCWNCLYMQYSVHPEIHNLMVGKLMFRTARQFLGRNSSFFSRIGKKELGVGE